MLPELNVTQDTLSIINKFGGINKNFMISESEFSDAFNVTNDYFPVLGNRRKRGITSLLNNPNGMAGGRYLTYVCGNKLYYNQIYVADLKTLNCERQIVNMGANLVIFPDGIIYNTATQEKSTIENETTVTGVTITLSDISGKAYTSDNTYVGTTEPDRNKYWLDTSSSPNILKQYSSSSAKWVSVPLTYVKFSATGIGKGFKAYDAVRFSGVDTNTESDKWIYNDYDFNEQAMVVYNAGDDFLITYGLINLTHTDTGEVKVKRSFPAMDYVCEHDNRIWGCSSDKHEIYCCKQGDPTNWEFYGGLDSDSYAATVGTQNVFTGCCSYRGYVFFFKEDGYHKIYGSKPSNYEISWNVGRGVQNGSSKSICIVGEYLMYKAREGVCIFDGTGTVVSDALGMDAFYDAVAGAYQNKYYICMRDKLYNYRLYVYDTEKNTWLIEGDTSCKYMALTHSGLYIVDYNNVLYCISNEVVFQMRFPKSDIYPNSDMNIGFCISEPTIVYLISPSTDQYPSDTSLFPTDNVTSNEADIEWKFETGDLGCDDPYQKYVKRLIIRVWLDKSTKMSIDIMYDSDDVWRKLIDYSATHKRSYEIPMIIQRCDHFKLRFKGTGDFKLYSIAKAIEEGSSR